MSLIKLLHLLLLETACEHRGPVFSLHLVPTGEQTPLQLRRLSSQNSLVHLLAVSALLLKLVQANQIEETNTFPILLPMFNIPELKIEVYFQLNNLATPAVPGKFSFGLLDLSLATVPGVQRQETLSISYL